MSKFLLIPEGASVRARKALARRAPRTLRPGHFPVLTTMAGLVSVARSTWRYVTPRPRVLS